MALADTAGTIILPKRVAFLTGCGLVMAATWSAAEFHFSNRANAAAIEKLDGKVNKLEGERLDIARLQEQMRGLAELVREVRDTLAADRALNRRRPAVE